MPAVTRKGDSCSGDGCFPPTNNVGGSGDQGDDDKLVYVNKIPIHRVGDLWPDHSCGTSVHTGRKCASGSSTVFANNKAVARIGDNVSCGSVIAQGSGNVSAG